MSEAPDGTAPPLPVPDDTERLRISLRRAELRLEGLRTQLDLRLAEIREIRSAREAENHAQVLAERDQARVDIATLLASKTFRYSQAPRRLYGRLLAVVGTRQGSSMRRATGVQP